MPMRLVSLRQLVLSWFTRQFNQKALSVSMVHQRQAENQGGRRSANMGAESETLGAFFCRDREDIPLETVETVSRRQPLPVATSLAGLNVPFLGEIAASCFSPAI